ncbi:TonB-dependent receptor [Xanthomonas axonopodis]|uniref:TonB-dependent receptor n=1 Tax=Xanthomonas axonopodis TaxID=53413 RepID=UPI00157B8C14|nr:TonB-dependent receptor [Xanthomonas axonopodis]
MNTDQLGASVADILATARPRHALASMTLLLAGAQALPALAQDARTLDAVSVAGTGSTRTTASISVDEIQAQVPGVAPQQLLASLPGVNVQTTDPFGLYEFGDSMTIRGLSAKQIGVTLDGIPIETVQSYISDGSVSWDLHERITGNPEVDAEHYSEWQNGRRDSLLSLHGDFLFNDAVGFTFTGYYENKHGYGVGGTPPSTATGLYNDAIAGMPGRTDIAINDPQIVDANGNVTHVGAMTRREEIMGGDRYGLTTAVSWETEHNKLEVGAWYENYDFDQVRPLYNLDPATGALLKSALPIVIYYDNHFSTEVKQLYIKDTLRLLEDRLTMEFGAKELAVKRDYNGIANLDDFNAGVRRDVSIKNSDWFQPQVGTSFQLAEGVQVFANCAENFSSAPRLALSSGAFNPNIAPEESTNIDIDIGIRAESMQWSGYLAAYRIDYENRIIALTDPAPLVVAPTVYANVGDVQTYGAEVSGMWKLAPGWRLGASLTWNTSEFPDNYFGPVSGNLVQVKGNAVPDAPKVMFSVNGGWEGAHFFANLDTKYTGKRYGDTLNTDRVDATFIVNGSVGYQGGDSGFLVGGRLQLSVCNLFDKDDAIGAVFTNESSGSYQLIAPRQLFASLAYTF